MAEFSSTIRIQDEFSSTLKDYTKEMMEATDITKMLGDAVVDGVSYMKDFGDQAMSAAIENGMNLIPSLQDTASAARDVGASLKNVFTDFGISSVKDLALSIVNLTTSLYESGKTFLQFGWNVGKFIFFMKNGVSFLSLRITTFLTKKLTQAYKSALQYVNKIVGENIDALNLEDKLVAMWGDAGKGANQRMYRLANELGENASELMQAAAKAASGGIGTDDFEDIYRFADKIAKLNPGDSTADVAQTLLQSIRNGHDAESITGLLGGGDLMTRELRRKGYERKLNHGDLQGALNIAKQVAEAAGYTQEKYEKAGQSLSNDFKYINNVSENIKKRLHEIYARNFEPIVHKIANLMRSEKFQSFIKIVEAIVNKIGKFVSNLIEGLIDNWEILAFMISSLVVSKVLLIGKLIGVAFKFRGIIGTVIKALISLVFRFKGLIMGMVGLNVQVGKLNVASIVTASKYLLIGAIAYGIYKTFTWITDEIEKATGKTVSWKGVLAGLIKSGQNGFQRLFTIIGNKYTELMRRYHADMIILKRQKYEEEKAEVEKWKEAQKNIIHGTFDPLVDSLKNSGDKEAYREAYDQRYELLLGIEKQGLAKLQPTLDELNEHIAALNEHQYVQFEDLDKGVAEAVESEGKTLIDEFSKWFNQILGVSKDIDGGIEGNHKALMKLTEQEEELRWLKAFSDRQIMSRYGYNTSNTYNRSVTFNGMSKASMDAHARSYAAFPHGAR